MKKSHLLSAVLACALTMHLTTSEAALLQFIHTWQGSGATATGHITIDDTFLLNPGSNVSSTSPFVVAFDITVTGSPVGSGTFGLSDFQYIFLHTGSLPLDFSRELVGQPTGGPTGDGLWGPISPSPGDGGDFGMVAAVGSSAPNAVWFFVQALGGDQSYLIELTSFRPVPIPAAVWLFGSGLLGLIGIARRKAA